MSGLGFTVTTAVGSESQPVEDWLYMKVAVPPSNPVTIPPLVTVAIKGLVLIHVPPVDGESVVVCPSQKLVDPVIETVGFKFT